MTFYPTYTMTQAKSTRLAELDALRGIAAMMVVLFHYTMNTGHAERFFNLGVTGVDLFFMISGFVIFMTMSQLSSAKEFIIGRIARLYPTYWLCVTLYFGFGLLLALIPLSGASFITFGANLTMLQNYLLQKNLDGVYWTLVVELLFYVFVLGLFVSKQLHRFEQIGGVLTILLLAYGANVSYHLGVWTPRIVRFLSLTGYFPLFLSGMVYYRMKFGAKTPLRFSLLLLCLISQVSLFHLGGDRFRWFGEDVYVWILVVYNIVFLLYIYGRLSFIVNRITLFLGTISYATYLTHSIINFVFNKTFRLTAYADDFWLTVVIKLCVLILFSYLIHLFVEKPTLAYAKKRWMPYKPQQIAIAYTT